ncbi:MAG: carboxypeptidase-like regulatory domain-containing protein [Planctomycetota bacterium]
MGRSGNCLGLFLLACVLVAFAACVLTSETTKVEASEIVRGTTDVTAEAGRSTPELAPLSSVGVIQRRQAEATESAIHRDATCSAEGVVLYPRGFSEDCVAFVRAWPIGDIYDERESIRSPVEGGRWRFEHLAPGTWVFAASAKLEKRTAFGRSAQVRLVADESATRIRIVLAEYVIEGRVVDSQGRPIANLPIAVLPESNSPYAETTNDAQSGFDRVERQFLAIRRESTTQRLAELESTQAMVVETLESRAMLAAQEMRLTAALANANAAAAPVIDIRGSRVWQSDTTDQSGRFRVPLSGPAEVAIMAPHPSRELPPVAEHTIRKSVTVEVNARSPRAEISLELVRAGRVVGRITRSDGGDVEGLNVFLRRVGSGGTDTGETGAGGDFAFDRLLPGTYLFYARGGGANGQDLSAHRRLVVREGERTDVETMLTPSSRLSGTLIDPRGGPVSNQEVIAIGTDNARLTRQARTDPQGRFTISGMYGTSYRLTVDGTELQQINVAPEGAHVEVGELRLVRVRSSD